MTHTHTPGPWHVQEATPPGAEAKEWFIFTSGGGYLANVNSGRSENEANARLIAAAPDLLAAATHLCELVEQRPYNAWKRLFDAIAKAEGNL